MRDTNKDECTFSAGTKCKRPHFCTGESVKPPITAQSIINNILLDDDPENIRETLHDMLLVVFMYFEDPSNEFKERVYTAYQTLYNALKDMEALNPRRA